MKSQAHCNAGLQVALGRKWCEVLSGNVIAGSHSSAVLLGNAIEGFHCGAVLLGLMQLKVSMVARCYGGMSLQVCKRIVMVGCSRFGLQILPRCY